MICESAEDTNFLQWLIITDYFAFAVWDRTVDEGFSLAGPAHYTYSNFYFSSANYLHGIFFLILGLD